MVMSPDKGGIFDVLLGLVRRGLGGRAGDGKQFVSWIHEEDFVRAIELARERDDLEGPLNIASPGALPYEDFMHALRGAAGVRIGLPATKWMLEVGAWAMRTDTELVLKSRRVAPERLASMGFAFAFPEWPSAAEDLVRRSKNRVLASRH
jgi:NAD dependent epimerase/dehydratase family enzyme